jgi:nucleotide-binding universal stress UspA family protein
MSTSATKLGILVGVDGSPESKVAVDWAARDAAMRGAPLKLVYVLNPPVVMSFPEVPMPVGYLQWQDEEAQKILESARTAVEEATKEHPVEVTSEIVSGPPVPTLVDLSKDAQLVVVGCRGRGALARGLLGSVSTGLVHHAHSPVAIIHDEDPLMAHPSKAPVGVGVTVRRPRRGPCRSRSRRRHSAVSIW